ncbi:MAG: lysine--tRNA ligase [Candidatus Gracilibacteria bacterium]|nr:lysine--tRNA ligase [Candidatus Gracilibacteria bacterium]
MEYSRESLDRMQKIQSLKDAGVICYANNYRGKVDINKIKEESEKGKVADADNLMENGAVGEFKTAGRLMQSRGMGKLLFGKLRDNTGDIQVCFAKDKVVFNTGRDEVTTIVLDGEEKSAFKIAEKFCQVGDYVGVIGDLFLTKHGESTIFVKEFQILSKAIRPLPEKFHGVQDQETIYRQRYLDLIMNSESYDRFLLRSKFIKTLRDFYHDNGFIEIETPVLGNAASGAAAQPFITHHNDFDEDFFLRIAPETALKKATVGRFEKVVEFTRNFRNEGSDPSHMQEFSAIEHYAAWWNFEDNIRFTEEMFDYIFDKLKLNREIEIKDKEGNPRMVNFTTPWNRIDYIAGVKDKSGIDIEAYSEEDADKLRADIKAAGFTWEGIDKQATATMIDYLFKKVLRPSIIGPAFVYNYPKTMQPLARTSDSDENVVEQFQVIVNGWEILKAYSELVDPKLQKENFDAQSGALEAGDEEATSGDDDFVLAMEYGMPPQSGWGMGIERILSLLTGQENLRDVVLFPLMRDEKNGKKENQD